MSRQKFYTTKPIKASMDMKIFNLIGTILVVFFALACLIPFYLVLTGSFTDEKWILTKGYSFFLNAQNFSTEGYKTVSYTHLTLPTTSRV